jgi:membrane protein required for colicin V production
MTALDILTLLLCGGAAFFGLQRGFVTESLSLGAWVAAVAAVKFLHAPVAAALTGMVGTSSGAAVLAFALIFGITFLAVRLVARAIGDKTKSSFVGSFDRILGLGFGLVKGLIGATLIFTLFSLIYDTIYGGSTPRPAWVAESRTYPLLNATSGALVDFVAARRKGGQHETGPADEGPAA